MGTMEEHFEDFLNDCMWYAPYREYLKNFEKLRGKPNVLFLTYEEVIADKENAINNVAKFLDKEASDENIKKLAAYLDFKTMKSEFLNLIFFLNKLNNISENPNTNMRYYMEMFNQMTGHNEDPENFIRRGKAGGYTEDMSEEYAKRFDAWMAEEPKPH